MDDETARDRIRAMLTCTVCGRLPLRPLVFPSCGHSSDCEDCCINTKPKKCPVCAVPCKTPMGKLRRNRALDSVLRLLFTDEYTDRPHTEDTMNEIARRQMQTRQNEAVQRYADDLRTGYSERASELIRVHYPGVGSKIDVVRLCECGLVCVPARARRLTKSGAARYFYGCPRWRPSAVLRGVKRKHGTVPSWCGPEDDGDRLDASEDGQADLEHLVPVDKRPAHCKFMRALSAAQRLGTGVDQPTNVTCS
jgi:hypothetical protein